MLIRVIHYDHWPCHWSSHYHLGAVAVLLSFLHSVQLLPAIARVHYPHGDEPYWPTAVRKKRTRPSPKSPMYHHPHATSDLTPSMPTKSLQLVSERG